MAEFEKILIEFFTGDGMTIARTVAVFIFGLLAVKLILLIVNKLSVRAHIDKTISSFVLKNPIDFTVPSTPFTAT